MHFELPIAAFVAAILSLAPLPWHWKAGTIPTISISLWLFASNIIYGVNAIIWAGNVNVVAPVWCDISTKIIMGANIALPASVFCLCVHLERVSSGRQTTTNAAQKRRRQSIDCLICFGVPVIYMALHFIVQGHRFDIIEDFGCRAAIYVSLASVFLIWVPVLALSFLTLILSALAFRNFWIRRITFARHLQTSNSALTPSRYFRLMAMSVVQMFWGLAIGIFNTWFTVAPGLRPWISWQNVHSNFSRVGRFPTVLIPPQTLFYTFFLWWAVPISSVLFFAFFAFGQDAVKEYRSWFIWTKRTIIRRPFKSDKPDKKISVLSLPSYSRGANVTSTFSISKSEVTHSPTKSEITLTAYSEPSKFPTYKWDPPAFSPFPDTPITPVSPSTTIELTNYPHDSWADTQTLSSYSMTSHP